MSQNTVKIIGIKVAPSSKDPSKVYRTYYFTGSFSSYELEHSDVQGKTCGSENTILDLNCQIGDEVELVYQKGFQDRAVLVGCNIVKPAVPSK